MDSLKDYLMMLFGDGVGFVYTPLKSKHGQWLQQFYHWPMEIASLSDWIATNSLESDVYISPTLFREKSSKKEYALAARTVWIEVDGQEKVDLSGVPLPTFQIQTSSEFHTHIYWSIHASPPEVVENINRRLTYHLEADSSGWDANQVLRPPGTWNHKTNPPLPVKLISGPVGGKFGPEAFDGIPDAPPLVNIESLTNLPAPEDVLSLHALPKDLWILISSGSETPVGYRSTLLMRIGYELAESGLTHPEIVSILLVADEKIKKFHGRTDQLLRLAEIASIAINKVLVTPSVPVYNLNEFLALEFNFFSHWGDMLPNNGNLLLFGPPGAGKTQFTLQTAIHLALNKTFLQQTVNFTESQPLLFFSFEMSAPGFQSVLRQQVHTLSQDERSLLAGHFHITAPGTRLPYSEVEKIIETIRPSGIFFDSMSSMALGRMSDEEEAQRITAWDAEIRKNYGNFTWYIHHNRKANSENKDPTKGQDVYGSYIYNAKFDSVINLSKYTPEKKPSEWYYKATKTRYGEFDTVGKPTKLIRMPGLTFALDPAVNPTPKDLKEEFGTNNNPPPPATGPTPKFNLAVGDSGSGHGDQHNPNPG